MKKLPGHVKRKIERAVDNLFDKLKYRVLGPKMVDKKLYIGFMRPKSLPGLYEAAHVEERGIPDKEHLDQLLQTAANYIDAVRLKAKNHTVVAVNSFLNRATVPTDWKTVLGGELADVYGTVKRDVHRIIDTEAQNVRNIGVLEGISRVNASRGIEDPVVFFVVVRDEHLCDECRKLHLLEDGKTPRVYKMSELGHGYHKRGETDPKVGGLHPHCRCSMTTLMPGFGFDAGGFVTWKREDWNEYARQHGVDKSELGGEFEPLEKADWKGSDVVKMLSQFGWTLDRAAKHINYVNPAIPTARPVSIKHEHSKGNVDPYWVGKYASDAGLKFNRHRNTVEVDPTHPYAESYRKAGHLKDQQSEMRTWTPAVPHQHVEISQLVAPAGDLAPWKVPMFGAVLGGPKAPAVAPIVATKQPDGTYLVANGGHRLEAAKQLGMTHVPVAAEKLGKSTREGIATLEALRERYEANANDSEPYKHGEKVYGNANRDSLPPHSKLIEKLENAPITVNLPPYVLTDLANDSEGRLKNLLEVGSGQGATDPALRKDYERDTLGIPHETDPTHRPIYGALHLFHDHVSDGRYDGGARPYGSLFFTLKPHVRERATYTPADSFQVDPSEVFMNHHMEQLAGRFIGTDLGSDMNYGYYGGADHHEVQGHSYGRYLEAQIHGGVYLGQDVDSLHLPPNHSDAFSPTHHYALQLAKRHGFKVIGRKANGRDEVLYDPGLPVQPVATAPEPTPEPTVADPKPAKARKTSGTRTSKSRLPKSPEKKAKISRPK
jgi:hypothetical protein